MRRCVQQSDAAAGDGTDVLVLLTASAPVFASAHHQAPVLRQAARVVGRRLPSDPQESAVSNYPAVSVSLTHDSVSDCSVFWCV